MKKYVSNFTLQFGPTTTIGSLVSVRLANAKPKFSYVSPDGKPVEQRYIEPESGTLYTVSELGKAVVTKEEVKAVDMDVLTDAKQSQLPVNVMTITVHPRNEVEANVYPADTNAYIFYPDPKNPANKGWSDFITAAILNSDQAFMGQVNLRNNEGLFRLTVWRGHLLLQKQLYPQELNEHEVLEEKFPPAVTHKATAVAEQLSQPFDPASYRDEVAERLQQVADEATGEAVAGVKRTAAPTPQSFDLLSALDVFDNV